MAIKLFQNKKGIFFSIVAIVLSFVLILAFSSENVTELKKETDVIEVRITTMNNFIKDVEEDLEKGLSISSFRAFASMSQYIANNGSYLADVDNDFSELVIDGTIQGTQPGLMIDSTFTDWVGKIEEQATKLDINVNFTIESVTINQSDPWTIAVLSKINFTVNDTRGTSSWRRIREIEVPISILNFEDPFYIVHTSGKITNTIVQTPYKAFTINGDVTNLLAHTNESYYVESPSAPNYLQRLEGDFSNATTGIESLVNLEEFQEQGVSISSKTIVDYIYFSASDPTKHRINNTPSWFRIDSDHLEKYQVQNLTI